MGKRDRTVEQMELGKNAASVEARESDSHPDEFSAVFAYSVDRLRHQLRLFCREARRESDKNWDGALNVSYLFRVAGTGFAENCQLMTGPFEEFLTPKCRLAIVSIGRELLNLKNQIETELWGQSMMTAAVDVETAWMTVARRPTDVLSEGKFEERFNRCSDLAEAFLDRIPTLLTDAGSDPTLMV